MKQPYNIDERIILHKFRRAKRYAKNNKQAELNICILPGGSVFLMKCIFQDKIHSEEALKIKEYS